MGNYFTNHGTLGTNSGYRKCGNDEVYCDGNCCNCNRAEVLFSTRNQTSNTVSIHIVKKP